MSDNDNKMTVLVVSIDVSNLSTEEVIELQAAMEAQSEEYDNAVILSSDVRDITDEDFGPSNEEDTNLH